MDALKIVVVIATAALFLGAVASSWAAEPVTVITKADNGKEITVPKGATFEVRLEQASGTGYMWEIVKLDESRLKVIESTDTVLSHDRALAGGPLRKTWKIEATGEGTSEIEALLYRVWEGTGKAAESFHATIRVR